MRGAAVQRALDAEIAALRERAGDRVPAVLDVGGGSGAWAVPLAAAGCVVTVVDPSPNALATLQQRAGEAGVADRVRAVQGDADALGDAVPAAGADLVLGHGILEVVDDPAVTARALGAAAAVGGAVSVLAANRYAAVLGRAIAGRLGEARALLLDPAGRLHAGEAVRRRFDGEGLHALLAAAGLVVELLQGDGVVAELVPGAVLETQAGAADELVALELAAAQRPPLRDVAARLHLLCRRVD